MNKLGVILVAALLLGVGAQSWGWWDGQLCDHSCASCWYGYDPYYCYDCGANRYSVYHWWFYYSCYCYSGYYDDGYSTDCIPCSHQCSTCASATYCYSCNGANRGAVPSCSCLAGFYDNGSPNCVACHYSCNTCSNGYSCDSCNGYYNRYMLAGSSFCSCPARYYDTGSVWCNACDPTCLSCYGTASNNCNTCNGNAMRTLSGTSCVCMTGYYAVSSTVEQCGTCHYSCVKCVNTATTCTSCNAALFRALSGTSCPCIAGYFENSSQMCQPCSYQCTTCVTSASNCLSCGANRGAAPTCACLPYYFDDGSSTPCIRCQYSCSSCSSLSKCDTCNSTYLRLFTSVSAFCVCPDRYYDPGSEPCTACDPTCFRCSGGTSTSCTACNSGAFRGLVSGSCQCRTGYYSTFSTVEQCQPCLYSCLNCTTSAINCVACNATLNRVLTGSSCPCKPTYFENSSSLCDTCHSSCATCNNKLSCLTCFASQLTVINATGFCSCAAGNYWNVNVCSVCSYFCLTCQGSATNCTSCPVSSNRVFSTGSCACLAGYYDNSAVVCLACSYTCQTCTSGLTTGCSLCDSSKKRSLSAGACVCKTGYFDDGSNSACQQCNYKCLTCNAATSCLTCNSTLFRSYSAATGFCECFSNYYESNNVCLPCLTTCLTCINGNTCATCNSTLFRVLNTSTYACDCMAGYYQNSSGLCAPCLSLCNTCNSGTTCLACKPNLNRTLNSSTSTCDCNTGYILVATSNLCLTCQATCRTCVTNYTDRCASCDNTTLRTLNNTSFQCQCPLTGYYDDGVNLACQPCSYTCLSCSSATACLSCPSASNRVYDSAAKTCMCLQHFYDNNITFVQSATCLACLYHCSSCIQGSSCLTCNASNYRQLSKGKCVCLPGYYDDGSHELCVACNYRCLTCTNASACLACNSTWNRDTPASKCPCSTGFYDNSTAVCRACHYSCLTCTVASQCATCQPLYNRVPNSTTKLCSCTEGYYDPGSAICQVCSYSCLTCATTGSSCLTCNTTLQRTFAAASKSCPCNNGYYDNAAPLCLPCNYTCSTCSNNRSCLTCNLTRFRTINTLTGLCVCITSYYDNNSTETCLACHPTCLTCINSTNCTSCEASRNRAINHTADYANTTDYLCPCLYKYYSLGTNSSCSPCHFSCSYCSSSTNKSCLYCNAASFRKLKASGECSCIDGYYDTNTTEPCPSCNVGCLTCWDKLTTTCFTCNSTNFMMVGANTCYVNCPTYYFNNVSAMICTLCQAHCLYCIDSTNCTQCEAPMFLFNSSCMPTCPLTFYPNSTTHKCEACKDGCANCTTSYNCFKCVNTSYYVDQATTLCQLCSPACLTCFGPTENNCLNCTYPLFLSERHMCVTLSCSYGKYLDTFKGCLPCKTLFNHSITCNLTHAFLCDSQYLLSDAQCLPCNQVIGYSLDSYGKCNEICGDGLLIYYQCDDGNNKNGDGCSANCIIEEGWNCSINANKTSICRLAKQLSISLKKVIKFARQNTVRIMLQLNLPLQLTDRNFFLQFSNLSSLYYSYEVLDQDQTKLNEVGIDIDYERDIQNEQITLSYSDSRRRLQEMERSDPQRSLLAVAFTSNFNITAFPPANFITAGTYTYYDISTEVIFYLSIILTILNLIVVPRRYALHSLTLSWIVPYLYFTLFLSTSYSTEGVASIATKLKHIAAYQGFSLGECCVHDYIQSTTSELLHNVGAILCVLAASWVVFGILAICSSQCESESLVRGYRMFKYYMLTAHLYCVAQLTYASTTPLFHYTLNNRIDAINITLSLFLLIAIYFSLVSLCYITSISKFDGSFEEKSSQAATRQTVHNSKDTEQNESNIVINLSNIKDAGSRGEQNEFYNSTTHLASSIVLNKNATRTSGFTVESREKTEQSEEEMGEEESFLPFDYCYLYNHSRPKSKYFLPLLMSKVFLYSLSSAALTNHPFAITLCHATLTTIFLLYLIGSKPFKSKFTLARLIIVEILVLVLQGMFCVYQYFALSLQYIRNIEFCMILVTMVLLLAAAVFAIVQQLKIWQESIKKLCENCCLSLRLKGQSRRVHDNKSEIQNQSNNVKVQTVQRGQIGQVDAFYARMLQRQALNKQYKRQRMIYDANAFS